MEIQRKNLDIIFRRISPSYIFESIKADNEARSISNIVLHNKISFEVFIKFSRNLYPHYSENEIFNIYNVMNDELRLESNTSKTIFSLLYKYGEKVLLTDDRFPICRYDEILNWRELTNKLGQDILTTAYLAYKDLIHNELTPVFSWRPVIKTDNARLYHILEKGLAENHYHLHGSTQVFPLSWIYIMNYFSSIDRIADMFEKTLDRDVLTEAEYSENYWSVQLKRAVIIRAYLFKRIIENKAEDKSIIDLLDNLSNYQEIINSLKFNYAYRIEETNCVLDYALMKNLHEQNFNSNRILAGERFFLYGCFKGIYSNNFSDYDCNLFYLYLVIKSQFRGELVQVNDNVGFQNFQNYQARKGYISELNDCYQQEVYNLALNATLEDQNIRSLEARIMPKSSARKMKQTIEYIDDIKRKTQNSSDINSTVYSQADNILNESINNESDSDRYCFILHFPKSPFKIETDENCNFIGKCRNHELRVKNKKCAKAVANALANNYKLRKRIKGIDGCANEIGCRPETLANELRYLSNFNPISTLSYDYQNKEPLSLRVTYHVGEDFLDIVDGLRAIDEAIYFINLKRNDRIGHALALGIDVNDYYKSKNYKVVLPKQDLLDNLIWILHKSEMLNVELSQRLRNKISILVDELLMEIYKEFTDNNRISINQELYFHSWELRGDDPNLYCTGKYVYENDINSEYLFYCKNPRVNNNLRYNRDVSLLYYAYHFDAKVKIVGQEMYVFKVENVFIELVLEFQKQFQFEIADKEIAIECNPSSNYLIGTFKRFDKHPIIQFYNRSLVIDPIRLKQSPQLCVSINTDDQGVFDTYLENEFALLASSLEKIEKKEGQEGYSSMQIYSWLDDIREMGLEQSFNS